MYASGLFSESQMGKWPLQCKRTSATRLLEQRLMPEMPKLQEKGQKRIRGPLENTGNWKFTCTHSENEISETEVCCCLLNLAVLERFTLVLCLKLRESFRGLVCSNNANHEHQWDSETEGLTSKNRHPLLGLCLPQDHKSTSDFTE